MKSNKGIIHLWLLLVVLVLLGAGGFFVFNRYREGQQFVEEKKSELLYIQESHRQREIANAAEAAQREKDRKAREEGYKNFDQEHATFTFNDLGIEFVYPTNKYHLDGPIDVLLPYLFDGYVCIPFSPAEDRCSGQTIERFEKDASKTLEEVVTGMFLKNRDSSVCKFVYVEEPYSRWIGNGSYDGHDYIMGIIRAFGDPEDGSGVSWREALMYCEEEGGTTSGNGIHYYVMDPLHPERFYLVSLGNGGLESIEKNGEMVGWDQTLRIF